MAKRAGATEDIKKLRKLTGDVETILLEALALGTPKAKAAQLAGIHPATLYRWIEQGEADLETDRETALSALCEAIKRAEAAFVTYALQTIHDAAPKQWQAAAWLLERKHPEDWALKRGEASLDSLMEALKAYQRQVEGLEDDARAARTA
jgi:hypothetical protein